MKRFLSAAVAVSALVASTQAFAADFLPGFIGPSPDGNGAATFVVLSGNPFSGPISATFSRTGLDDGIFQDRFLFTIDQNGLGSGSITTILSGLIGGAGDLDFINVTFDNGVDPVFDVNTGPNGALEQGGLLNVPIYFGVQNIVTVDYEARGEGAFSGVLSFTPNAIPEPATWAMMLAGFGAVGFGMRRRQRQTVRVNFV